MKPMQIMIFLPTFEHQRPKNRRAKAKKHNPETVLAGNKHK